MDVSNFPPGLALHALQCRVMVKLCDSASSIEGGGTSAIFPYYDTSAFVQIFGNLYGTSAIFPYYDTGTFSNFWKLHTGKLFGNYMLGNFLETICWEIFWKLYAGNLLMETMCWEIRVDAGSFLMGVIMAQCYSIILQFQSNGTWSAS